MSERSLDAAVAARAVPRLGAFTVAEAREVGATYPVIERRCRSGTWLRGPGRILQLPGFRPTFEQRLWWALLLAGAGAVVSHWAAAAMHGLTGFPRSRLSIVVPHGRTHVNPVAQVFQTTAPPAIVVIRGLPVTPIERTIVDCGRLVGPRRLGAALDDADADGRLHVARLEREVLELSAPGRNGMSTVHQVLAVRADTAPVPARATLERHLDDVLDRLPVHFEKEAPLPGREWSSARVDRLCRSPLPLIVEGDGRRWHTRVADFPRDARRRREALAAGFPTANFLYEEVRSDKDAVEVEVRTILGLSRAQ